MSGKDNLIPLTTEKAREIGKKGGIASGKAKREKKLMSAIYAEYLEKEHDLGGGKKITGEKRVSLIIDEILQRGDSPAVAMMKEIRSATEGDKLNVTADINVIYADEQDKDV